jgi:serine/threonine protein kinase
MEYCPGTLLSEVDEDRVGLSYIQSLERLVSEIHERGIVHSDLKKKDNLLITDQNEPVIIDFGTHFSKKSGFRPVNNFLYRQFHQMDNNAVSKLKNNFCPGKMTQRDRDRLDSPTFLERADRFRRDYVWDW